MGMRVFLYCICNCNTIVLEDSLHIPSQTSKFSYGHGYGYVVLWLWLWLYLSCFVYMLVLSYGVVELRCMEEMIRKKVPWVRLQLLFYVIMVIVKRQVILCPGCICFSNNFEQVTKKICWQNSLEIILNNIELKTNQTKYITYHFR